MLPSKSAKIATDTIITENDEEKPHNLIEPIEKSGSVIINNAQPQNDNLPTVSNNDETHSEAKDLEQPRDDVIVDMNPSPYTAPFYDPAYLAQIEAAHKQIIHGFAELLELFNNYTNIILGRQQSSRSASTTTLKCEQYEEPTNNTVIFELPPKTCNAAIQTSTIFLAPPRPLTLPKKYRIDGDKRKKSNERSNIHVLIDEETHPRTVKTVWHQKIRNCLHIFCSGIGRVAANIFVRVGENCTYLLFVIFCLWCLYLIFAHFYSFIVNHGHQYDSKPYFVANSRHH